MAVLTDPSYPRKSTGIALEALRFRKLMSFIQQLLPNGRVQLNFRVDRHSTAKQSPYEFFALFFLVVRSRFLNVIIALQIFPQLFSLASECNEVERADFPPVDLMALTGAKASNSKSSFWVGGRFFALNHLCR
jgi:hypothetical protein